MRTLELVTGVKRASFHWPPVGCAGEWLDSLTSSHSVPVQYWTTNDLGSLHAAAIVVDREFHATEFGRLAKVDFEPVGR